MSEGAITSAERGRTLRTDAELARELVTAGWGPALIALLAVVLLVGVYLSLNPPQYLAESILLVQSQSDALADKSAPVTTPELVRSQLDVIESEPILESVIRRLSLAADPELASHGRGHGTVMAAAEQLSRRVAVENDGRSYVIRLKVRSRDPQKAARIANTIADTYVAFEHAQKVHSVETVTHGLSDRVDDLRQRAEAAEQAVESFRQSAGLVLLTAAPDSASADDGFSVTSREALEAARLKAELDEQQATADARLQEQQAQIGSGAGGSTSEVVSSPLIIQLRGEETALAGNEAQLLAKYQAGHPLVAPVHAQLIQVRTAIADETARLHQMVRAQSDAARRSQALLNGKVSSLNKHVDREIAAMAKLHELQDDARIQRGLYEQVAAQAGRAAQTIDTQLPDVLIVSPASPPLTPATPKKPLVFAAVMVLGLVGAAGASVLNAVARSRLLGPADAARVTGLPVASVVPWARASNPSRPLTKGERADFIRLTARALQRSGGRKPVVIGLVMANGADAAGFVARWAGELHTEGAAVLLISDTGAGIPPSTSGPALRTRSATDLSRLIERDPSFTAFRTQVAADFQRTDFVLIESDADNLLVSTFARILELHLCLLVVDSRATTRSSAEDTAQGLRDLSVAADGLVLI
jgi:uncharacterized protein involved in exopolysaccharide biosynthesis